MKSVLVSSIEGWQDVAQALQPYLKAKTLFLLDGDLGAGKTTLVNVICRNLKIPLSSSPTYSLIHEYSAPQFKIYHVDLYRLENEDDIASSGFWDLMSESQAVIFVEWSSRVNPEDWPLDWEIVTIQIDKKDHERKVEINLKRN